MGKTLPKFEEYRQRILRYAAACGISVEWKEEDSVGMWVPTRRVIRIDPSLDDTTEIAVLLHELGHQMDDALWTGTQKAKRIEQAYYAVLEADPTNSQLQTVLECEGRAWDMGRAIAHKLRIPLGSWYGQEEVEMIQGFRQTISPYTRRKAEWMKEHRRLAQRERGHGKS